jgi:fumarate reductase flavoprotein subunit
MNTLETEVAVIGSGAAGMAAALTAAECGAQVSVLEKHRGIGGISVYPAEIFAAESRLQRENNIPLTADEAFKVFMDGTQWKADARLVRSFIDKSADTIQWLELMGVPFDIRCHFVYRESRLTAHCIQLPGLLGSVLRIMRTKAEEMGVHVHVSTPARRLLKNGSGIAGIVAEDKNGRAIEIKARAVVIAAGGYPNDLGMVRQYSQLGRGQDLTVLPPIKLTGDGIRMAWEVGAVPDGMSLALRYDMPSQGGHARRWELSVVTHQPYLWVNQQGDRFFDESICQSGAYTANALARQKNSSAYLIFDEDTKRHIEEDGWDNPMGPASSTNIDGMLNNHVNKGVKNILIAHSLEELAAWTGIDHCHLASTLAEYNHFCDRGRDELFAKDPKFLRPVRKPKFYAFKIIPMAYGTVGGIMINAKTEVMNEDHEAIPGLYAAGDCANGAISHNFWLAFTLRGLPSSFALNTGRVAGENAARLALGA